MKKNIIAFIAAVLLLPITAMASDRLIPFDELPAEAQQFVKAHFADAKVLQVKAEKDEYEVLLTNGFKLEFDLSGNWKEVKGRQAPVPEAVIPVRILSYVKEYYPDMSIMQIERSKWGYELELAGGLELEFDRNCNFVRVDD